MPDKAKRQLLVVGWAPTHDGEDKAFDSKTYSGGRLRDLMGVDPHSVAVVEYLLPSPVDDEKGADYSLARQRAVDLLIEHPKSQLLLIGREAARAFGVDKELGRNGYFHWFNTGERLVSVIPHPSGVNRWWNDKQNMERARLFLRDVSGVAPLGRHDQGGETVLAIDPDELERLAELHPTISEAAAFFRVSESTLKRRLRDPLYREAWETGKARTNLALRRIQLAHARRGNTKLLIHLGEVLLGQMTNSHQNLNISLGEPQRRLTITREELEETLSELDARYEMIQAGEVREERVVHDLRDNRDDEPEDRREDDDEPGFAETDAGEPEL